jgi:phage terminase Nu1 subunit (DNA packaging protein)
VNDDKDKFWVDKIFLANLFFLSERRIYQLVKDDVIPKNKNGKYNLVGAIRGYLGLIRGQGYQLTETIDTHQEKARLIKAQADKAELEVLKIRGELVNVNELSVEFEKVFIAFREKALSIPTKLAPLLLNQNSIS